jgi:predicted dehydrogenase
MINLMKFLIIGCGSIGKRHILNLKQISPKSEISGFDSNFTLLKKTCNDLKINQSLEKNLDDTKYDCVFICTPPSTHVQLAKRVINSGSNIFIEKPISSNSKQISSLLSHIKKKKVLTFVGYNLRFHKSIFTIKKLIDSGKFGNTVHVSSYFGSFLPDWRSGQDYSKNYTARNDLGGGIIYDGSHELDYLRYFFGNPKFIQSNYKNTKFLKSDTEAIVDIILEFDNDLIGTIHLDYLRREYKRTLEILFDYGIIEWSLTESKIKIFNAKSKKWKILTIHDNINEMYVDELKHVLLCIKNKTPSKIINLKNGIDTLLISEIIKKSKSGKKVCLTR